MSLVSSVSLVSLVSSVSNLLLVASHGRRINCLFLQLFPDLYKKYNFNEESDEINFYNCAAIRIFNTSTGVSFELIHDGYGQGQGERYWTKQMFNGSNLTCNGLLPVCDNIFGNKFETEIILIRHGEGEHNANRYYQGVNPYLTQNGINQAINTGKFLNQYLSKNVRYKNSKITLCGSDLIRTQQTIGFIYYGMEFLNKDTNVKESQTNIKNIQDKIGGYLGMKVLDQQKLDGLIKLKEELVTEMANLTKLKELAKQTSKLTIHIIPCAHEVGYCRFINQKRTPTSSDDPNETTCFYSPQSNIIEKRSNCKTLDINGIIYNLDYTAYINFYKENKKCDAPENNLIHLCLDIVMKT
jgi:hypothetical protein